MLNILISNKRKLTGVVPKPKRTLKRRNFEIEEVAWEEDIHQRKDGRIFNQFCGFADDEKIRKWEVPGKCPMRSCSCETCKLHGRRRLEYILCALSAGRSHTYDIKLVAKQLEKEHLEQYLPVGELEAHISEACRNKTVLLTKAISQRVESCIAPTVPIGNDLGGVNFHACEFCNVIQHVNFKLLSDDPQKHLPTCRFHQNNLSIRHNARRMGRPRNNNINDDPMSPIKRFICNDVHSAKCPFHICRNADRYAPSVTHRGRVSSQFLLADFSCSYLYDVPEKEAAAAAVQTTKQQHREQKKQHNDLNATSCLVIGCADASSKKFSTKNNTGTGIEIEYICRKHYERLKRNKNRLSALWTPAELAENHTRQCSYLSANNNMQNYPDLPPTDVQDDEEVLHRIAMENILIENAKKRRQNRTPM